MITLDLDHLFKTDPNSRLVPKKVFDWIMDKEKQFSVNYQVRFSNHKTEENKNLALNYERVFYSDEGSSPETSIHIMAVSFPLNDGIWSVRITGARRPDGTFIPFSDIDNPKDEDAIGLGYKYRSLISGLRELLDSKNPLLEIIESSNKGHEKVYKTLWGYKRVGKIDLEEEKMVKIRCDRNVNDEWEFRGTPGEFMDQYVKPLLN